MHEDELRYYLCRLPDEDAVFALMEAGNDVLPQLEAQFRQEPSAERRAALTRIIWEHRDPLSLHFLASALVDPDASVWQEALNGMVTIGGEEACTLLRRALSAADREKADWIIEALAQLPVG